MDFCAYPSLAPPIGVHLRLLDDHACPYLPGRVATYRACRAERIPGSLYHAFMDSNFRRNGTILYQPICAGCRKCVQIRVPVRAFASNRSQRRCERRNRDLNVTVAPANYSDEAFELYQKYVVGWHGSRDRTGLKSGGENSENLELSTDDEVEIPTPESLKRFLYDSPVDSLQFCHRDRSGKLLAVGICDVSLSSLSSVYFYFDPDHRERGLGTFGALFEISWARERGIEQYYLGYWVDGCRRMDYKMSYRPAELLGRDGVWRDADKWKLLETNAVNG